MWLPAHLQVNGTAALAPSPMEQQAWIGLGYSALRSRRPYCASPDVGHVCDDLQSPGRRQNILSHPPHQRHALRDVVLSGRSGLVRIVRPVSQPNLPRRARHSREKQLTAQLSARPTLLVLNEMYVLGRISRPPPPFSFSRLELVFARDRLNLLAKKCIG